MKNKLKLGTSSIIEDASIFINIKTPIQIGDLKLNVLSQIVISQNDDLEIVYDNDIVDYEDITYMDKEIKNWREFCNFHSSIGIDFSYKIKEEIKKNLSEKTCDKIAFHYGKLIF